MMYYRTCEVVLLQSYQIKQLSTLTVLYNFLSGFKSKTQWNENQVMKKPQKLISILCVCVKSLSCVPTLCDPTDCTRQAPLSMEFSRQEYWIGLPFPSPGDLPNPEAPIIAGRFFTVWATREAYDYDFKLHKISHCTMSILPFLNYFTDI